MLYPHVTETTRAGAAGAPTPRPSQRELVAQSLLLKPTKATKPGAERGPRLGIFR